MGTLRNTHYGKSSQVQLTFLLEEAPANRSPLVVRGLDLKTKGASCASLIFPWLAQSSLDGLCGKMWKVSEAQTMEGTSCNSKLSWGNLGMGFAGEYWTANVGVSHSAEGVSGLWRILETPPSHSMCWLSRKALAGINKRIIRKQFPLLYRLPSSTTAGLMVLSSLKQPLEITEG